MFDTPFTATNSEFSVREARDIVREHFRPQPLVYWGDLLGSAAVAYTALAFYLLAPLWSATFGLALAIACVAFYRLASFVHELMHLRRGTFARFRVAWNVVFGIPFLMPSFMYHTHLAHHGRTTYGTRDDGEYLPLANRPVWHIVLFILAPLYVPALAVIRFAILAPVAWLCPPARRLIQQRASSLVIEARYLRPLPTRHELRVWRVQEAASFCVVATAVGLILAGVIDVWMIGRVYVLATCVLFVNQVRTLGAHRFRHVGGELTFTEQLLDSINYPHRPLLGELWAPIGLRYHALHHLFPSMPYHQLGKAHRSLMAQLPADSPYRQTVSPSLWSAIQDLWRAARDTNSHVRDASPHSATAA